MKQEKWLLCPVCGNKTRLKFYNSNNKPISIL